MHAKSFQLHPSLWTLWTIAHGILQARILEWITMPSSKGFSQPRDRTLIFYLLCLLESAGGFFTTSATSEVPIGLGLTLIRLHCNLITSGKTLLPNKVTLTDSLASNNVEISCMWGIHLTTGLTVEATACMGISMGNQDFNNLLM